MAWRKPSEPPRVEPPGWYRHFDPAAWDEPDGQEQAMIDGWFRGQPWPDHLHEIHAHRRWAEAKHAHRQEHPALATQEFREIVSGEWRAREDERHGREA